MVGDNLKQHKWSVNLRFKYNPLPIDEPDRIRSSTLVLVGNQDMRDILAISDILHNNIPHARKVVISEAAHMLNPEKPVN